MKKILILLCLAISFNSFAQKPEEKPKKFFKSIYEEFYYWFDPEHINKELTIFTRIDDIKRLYESTAEDA